MDLELSESELAFREEARSWLAANVPAERLPSLDTPEGFVAHQEWEAKLAEDRWAVVSWPERYHGRDASLIEWVLFEEEYGYEVPEDQITILDTGVIYTQTAKGDCDFGEIFTTDGRIEELNIELVEDPGVFILYNASFTWNNEHYTANAETYDEIADTIFAGLDEETMTGLNYQVDIEGESASDVAQQYLTDIGLL